MLDMLVIADRVILHCRFLFLHGGIPTGDRMPLIDKFQSDPNVYVFRASYPLSWRPSSGPADFVPSLPSVISTLAGGV